MKKKITLPMMLILLLLCGCNPGETENSETRFLFDTVCTVTAGCGGETLDGAFALCERLEGLLSRTVKESDVYKLNSTDGFVTVSDDTLKIAERAVYYSGLTDGRFDITICPVSALWDFKNQIVPDRSEIAEALKNVDYHSIEIRGNEISLHGGKIDLGGIAKGYVTDKLIGYFTEKGVQKALINLGGNIGMIGEYNIGIQMPFEDSAAASIVLRNKCVSTCGIYERYIEEDGKIYHHVLDPDTGYGVENELASVTVIGDRSIDCDALSTACLLLGAGQAQRLIDSIADTEAVLIDRDNRIILSSGLYRENDKIYLK